MSNLPDDLILSDMSIPGTHDTMTSHSLKCVMTPGCNTQNWQLEDQLKNGIRFLDIRLRHFKDCKI